VGIKKTASQPVGRRRVLAAAAAGAALVANARPSRAAGPVALRFGSPMPAASTYTQAMTTFADELARLSDGRIKVANFPSGQLGGLKEMLTAVQLGTQSMVMAAPSWLSNFSRRMDVFSLPYLAASEDKLFAALDGPFGDGISASLETSGFKVLAWWASGPRHMLDNVRPIHTPDDMKGLKMRAISSPVWLRTFRALGANPVALDYPEVYLGLQQHTVDGFDGAPTDILSGKFYEVCKFMALTEHVYDFYVVAINRGLWSRIPQEDQALMMQAMRTATQTQRKAQQADSKQATTALAQHLTQNPITPPERAKFQEAVQPVYAEFEKSAGKEFLDQARAALS
jgi:tripartite ATP-independent transporter DctP family solute receptor